MIYMDTKIKLTAIALLMFSASAGAQTLSQAQRWLVNSKRQNRYSRNW